VSVSHRTASFALLERLSECTPIGEPVAGSAGVRGAVEVSTCHRYECYLDAEDTSVATGDHPAIQDLLENLARRAGLPADRLRDAAQQMTGSRAAAHLFAVASGLDSVMVGENEIAGQVRRALVGAREAGMTTSALERVFQTASTTSRKVKNLTKINAAGRSMVRLALDLAESRLPVWPDTRVLLIGTGAYAGAAWAALRERGVADIDVASPSGREQVFARREGVHAVPVADRPDALARADLVITSTTTQALTAGDIGTRTTNNPLLIVDLGLPRNVDEQVATLANTELLDLETISLHAPVQELDASAQAMDLVQTAAQNFDQRTAERAAAPAIVAYRNRVGDVLAGELDRLAARGRLTDDVERALRHFAGVLAHGPTTRARQLAAKGRLDAVIDALDTLYDIQLPADHSRTESGAVERLDADWQAS
jgi:glutamyl-tRNA reductase